MMERWVGIGQINKCESWRGKGSKKCHSRNREYYSGLRNLSELKPTVWGLSLRY
jgi:hypothetical protein